MIDERIVDYLRGNFEKIKLTIYFIVIGVVAAPIAEILATAWNNSPIVRAILYLPTLLGIPFEDVTVGIFGIFVGFLVILTIDVKKRWQGVLLSVGTLLTVFGLSGMGLLLPNISILGSFPWFLGGVMFTIAIFAGTQLKMILNAGSIRHVEFREAAQWFYRISLVVIVIALLEYHIRYPVFIIVNQNGVDIWGLLELTAEFYATNLPRNLVVSALFLVTLHRFVQYDAEKRFFVLGPKNSGKSLFLIGSYLTALRSTDDWDPSPSEELISMVSEIDRDHSGWGIDATTVDEVRELDFQYVHGNVFPMNIKVSSLDYSGEYLSRLPDAITGAIPEEDLDEELSKLKEGVEDADVLLLLIDCERYMDEQSLNIEPYFSILEGVGNKSEMLIASKADFLADEFYDEQGLEAHKYPGEFREYLNDRLRNNAQADSLVQQVGNDTILPVFYQTKETDEGDRIPLRDEEGDVVTVGFEPLLEKLARW